MEAVANYNFKPTESDELGFEKGSILHIIELEVDPYWYKARLSGQEGMVPANYMTLYPHPWYIPKCSRRESEARLLEFDPRTDVEVQPDGAFILRQSENDAGQFSISVKDGGSVLHFRVFCDPSGLYYIWKNKFQSINALIDFHRQQTIYGSKTILLRNCLPFKNFGPTGSGANSNYSTRRTATNATNSQGRITPKNRSGSPKTPPSDFPNTVSKEQTNHVPSGVSFPPGIKSTDLAGRNCVAKYDFVAEFEGEMSFQRGDKIRVLGEEDSNWWYAELVSGPPSGPHSDPQNPQRGLIPAIYVELLPAAAAAGGASSTGQLRGQPSSYSARPGRLS